MQDYISLWCKYSILVKKSIFDTRTDTTMHQFGFRQDVTKKSILRLVLSEVLDSKRFDIIEEMHFKVLNLKSILNNYDMFENICFVVLKLEGLPYDNYWVYSLIDKFYTQHKKDISKAIDISIKAFNEIDNYLPDLIKIQLLVNRIKLEQGKLDEIGRLPSYVYCRDGLLFNLMAAKKFDLAEEFEQKMIKMDLFPDANGKNRLRNMQISRLFDHYYYLLSEGKIDKAVEKCTLLKDIDSDYASVGFKVIADQLLKSKNKLKAFEYYKIAIELNPELTGVDAKIQRLTEELSIDYTIDKESIIFELEKRQNDPTVDFYKLSSIAVRYYSINEYERSINLYLQLLMERPNDNSVLIGIVKAYSALGKQKKKEFFNAEALNYFISAYKLIENLKFPINSIEKARDKLRTEIKYLNSL